MRLPDDVQAIVEALYLRHTDLAQGTDEQRRQLTRKIVEQTVFSFPGQGWGWKSADPNRPPSKDAMAKQDGRRLLAFDLFDGGTRKPIPRPDAIDITGQHFIPVAGINHLGAVTPPPVQPPSAPPVDVGPELKALKAEIEALRSVLVELVEDYEAVKSRPVIDQAAVGAAVAAMLEGYEVSGKSAVAFGHQHVVKLAITRKS